VEVQNKTAIVADDVVMVDLSAGEEKVDENL
jgi:hypothetical protein